MAASRLRIVPLLVSLAFGFGPAACSTVQAPAGTCSGAKGEKIVSPTGAIDYALDGAGGLSGGLTSLVFDTDGPSAIQPAPPAPLATVAQGTPSTWRLLVADPGAKVDLTRPKLAPVYFASQNGQSYRYIALPPFDTTFISGYGLKNVLLVPPDVVEKNGCLETIGTLNLVPPILTFNPASVVLDARTTSVRVIVLHADGAYASVSRISGCPTLVTTSIDMLRGEDDVIVTALGPGGQCSLFIEDRFDGLTGTLPVTVTTATVPIQ